jgi:hypothetical protein
MMTGAVCSFAAAKLTAYLVMVQGMQLLLPPAPPSPLPVSSWQAGSWWLLCPAVSDSYCSCGQITEGVAALVQLCIRLLHQRHDGHWGLVLPIDLEQL